MQLQAVSVNAKYVRFCIKTTRPSALIESVQAVWSINRDQTINRDISIKFRRERHQDEKLQRICRQEGQDIWCDTVPTTKLTLTIGRGQIWICKSKAHMRIIINSDCISDVSPICYHSMDIRKRTVHDLDLDHFNEPRLNPNILIESPCATLYLMAMVILEIFTVEMYKTLTLTFRMAQGQI